MNRIYVKEQVKRLWNDINQAYEADKDVTSVMNLYTSTDIQMIAEALVCSGLMGEDEDGLFDTDKIDTYTDADRFRVMSAGIDNLYEMGIHTLGWEWDDIDSMIDEMGTME